MHTEVIRPTFHPAQHPSWNTVLDHANRETVAAYSGSSNFSQITSETLVIHSNIFHSSESVDLAIYKLNKYNTTILQIQYNK